MVISPALNQSTYKEITKKLKRVDSSEPSEFCGLLLKKILQSFNLTIWSENQQDKFQCVLEGMWIKRPFLF
jgi:hypothetical protein